MIGIFWSGYFFYSIVIDPAGYFSKLPSLGISRSLIPCIFLIVFFRFNVPPILLKKTFQLMGVGIICLSVGNFYFLPDFMKIVLYILFLSSIFICTFLFLFIYLNWSKYSDADQQKTR